MTCRVTFLAYVCNLVCLINDVIIVEVSLHKRAGLVIWHVITRGTMKTGKMNNPILHFNW